MERSKASCAKRDATESWQRKQHQCSSAVLNKGRVLIAGAQGLAMSQRNGKKRTDCDTLVVHKTAGGCRSLARIGLRYEMRVRAEAGHRSRHVADRDPPVVSRCFFN